jgi:alanine racemase
MTNIFERAWAEINLDNIAHNVGETKRIVSDKTKVMAVVKADAYGHGFLEVSKTLIESGIDYLAVALPSEATQLRKRSINVPILVLGYTSYNLIDELIDLDITLTVFDYSFAEAISRISKAKNKTAKVHIKIDTGMSRIGFHCCEDTIDKVLNIAKLPGIEVEGIFSHLSSADEDDETFTLNQFDRFINFCEKTEIKGLKIPIKHICNSAGTIKYPQMHLDMVRCGIMLYGLYPAQNAIKNTDLKPAMQLKAKIISLKEIQKDTPISYLRKYTTKENTKVATIPIGYADGYPRLLTGKARMIANDSLVPVVGSICMDQCMIDVSIVKNICVGDEVIVFGGKNSLYITVEDIANMIGTINYEIVCTIGKRIPRVYIQNNKVINVVNYMM